MRRAHSLGIRLAASLLVLGTVAACGPSLPPVPDGVSTISGYAEHLRDTGFSGAFLADHPGGTDAHALGLADRKTGTGNEVGTAFDIGSIAKSFTAAAVLRLVDGGLLGPETTLGELLAEVPADKREITVRQLLEHTSGLAEYHDTEGDFEPMSRAAALRRILGQELKFRPGTGEAYSNSGYTLAAILVEEVTGRTFTAVVGDLFAAAGLEHTGFYGSETLRAIPVATGYEGSVHGRNNPAYWEPTWALLGGGGIAATVRDLRTWWQALRESTLLRPESTRLLLDAVAPEQTVDGVRGRGTSGLNDFGFGATIVQLERPRAVLVVASNANSPEDEITTEVGLVLAQLLAG
ncbi:serine hydrolase domain-containing protein [Amycolatopsis aidingensis]|uniref:serine hydrolase domain-containing protein n=1 Tax=Amycolatopsis aidingensis TaxID=2842453 RepID=UPI001C0AE76E|nr:serine hydrolase domain-containing protein [Amycolatopsis aidingensis]